MEVISAGAGAPILSEPTFGANSNINFKPNGLEERESIIFGVLYFHSSAAAGELININSVSSEYIQSCVGSEGVTKEYADYFRDKPAEFEKLRSLVKALRENKPRAEEDKPRALISKSASRSSTKPCAETLVPISLYRGTEEYSWPANFVNFSGNIPRKEDSCIIAGEEARASGAEKQKEMSYAFWEMAKQNQVESIVTVAEERTRKGYEVEPNKERLFPGKDGRAITVSCEEWHPEENGIELLGYWKDNFKVRKYTVRYPDDGEPKTVYHFFAEGERGGDPVTVSHPEGSKGHPDFQNKLKSAQQDVLNFVKHVQDCQDRLGIFNEVDKKTYVHCAQGIDRTGAYCVLNQLLLQAKKLEEGAGPEDIYNSLNIPKLAKLVEASTLQGGAVGLIQRKLTTILDPELKMQELEKDDFKKSYSEILLNVSRGVNVDYNVEVSGPEVAADGNIVLRHNGQILDFSRDLFRSVDDLRAELIRKKIVNGGFELSNIMHRFGPEQDVSNFNLRVPGKVVLVSRISTEEDTYNVSFRSREDANEFRDLLLERSSITSDLSEPAESENQNLFYCKIPKELIFDAYGMSRFSPGDEQAVSEILKEVAEFFLEEKYKTPSEELSGVAAAAGGFNEEDYFFSQAIKLGIIQKGSNNLVVDNARLSRNDEGVYSYFERDDEQSEWRAVRTAFDQFGYYFIDQNNLNPEIIEKIKAQNLAAQSNDDSVYEEVEEDLEAVMEEGLESEGEIHEVEEELEEYSEVSGEASEGEMPAPAVASPASYVDHNFFLAERGVGNPALTVEDGDIVVPACSEGKNRSTLLKLVAQDQYPDKTATYSTFGCDYQNPAGIYTMLRVAYPDLTKEGENKTKQIIDLAETYASLEPGGQEEGVKGILTVSPVPSDKLEGHKRFGFKGGEDPLFFREVRFTESDGVNPSVDNPSVDNPSVDNPPVLCTEVLKKFVQQIKNLPEGRKLKLVAAESSIKGLLVDMLDFIKAQEEGSHYFVGERIRSVELFTYANEFKDPLSQSLIQDEVVDYARHLYLLEKKQEIGLAIYGDQYKQKDSNQSRIKTLEEVRNLYQEMQVLGAKEEAVVDPTISGRNSVIDVGDGYGISCKTNGQNKHYAFAKKEDGVWKDINCSANDYIEDKNLEIKKAKIKAKSHLSTLDPVAASSSVVDTVRVLREAKIQNLKNCINVCAEAFVDNRFDAAYRENLIKDLKKIANKLKKSDIEEKLKSEFTSAASGVKLYGLDKEKATLFWCAYEEGLTEKQFKLLESVNEWAPSFKHVAECDQEQVFNSFKSDKYDADDFKKVGEVLKEGSKESERSEESVFLDSVKNALGVTKNTASSTRRPSKPSGSPNRTGRPSSRRLVNPAERGHTTPQ